MNTIMTFGIICLFVSCFCSSGTQSPFASMFGLGGMGGLGELAGMSGEWSCKLLLGHALGSDSPLEILLI